MHTMAVRKFSKRFLLLACFVMIALSTVDRTDAQTPIGQCVSAEEALLADLIDNYRQQNGLNPVPLSKSLTTVAQYHVQDLQNHRPDTGTDPRGLACNLHSWSANGPWSPVCYTSDHAYAEGMWNKPAEITDNIYTSAGFENAYRHSIGATAQGAFNGWRNSPGHNAVMLNQGAWENITFNAMGVGIHGEYAVLWFGQQEDPQGNIGEGGCDSLSDCDFNDDGQITPADVVFIVNRIGSQDLRFDLSGDCQVAREDAAVVFGWIGQASP